MKNIRLPKQKLVEAEHDESFLKNLRSLSSRQNRNMLKRECIYYSIKTFRFNSLDSSLTESVYGFTRQGVAENNEENQSMTINITLKDAVKAYMESLKQAGKSPRTLYTYGKDFEQIQRFFGEEKKLSAILKPHVGKFMKSDELLTLPNGNRRANQTIKKTYRVLRAFFYWAQSEGYIEEVPMPKSQLSFNHEDCIDSE